MDSGFLQYYAEFTKLNIGKNKRYVYRKKGEIMNYFDMVIGLIGGLALFLYGMDEMGKGLSKTSGGKLESILERLTSTPIKAVLLGAAVTAVIQSSSATTVMVVGFVNSGIMRLSQAIGIIMGANIGTTMTAWILSLSGLEGDAWYITMLKPSTFSPILAIIAVAIIMFAKSEKKKNVATIMIGFAVLMTGMDMMSAAVSPLKDVPEFTNLLLMFSDIPLLGLLAGAILTAIIQSSSASVGILQALCSTGTVTMGTAIPIIMGQNIGTCITAILSSIGTSKNAKRAACVHLSFNVLGTAIFMIVFYSVHAIVNLDWLLNSIAYKTDIATVHSIFNVCATLLLLPCAKLLERLACFLIRNEVEVAEEDKEFKILDSRFLSTPSIAMEHCKMMTDKMAVMAQEAITKAIGLVWNYDEKVAEEIKELESRVDRYEDELGTYLVQLSSKKLNIKDSQTLSELLHCIGDFERISDHALNIEQAAKEMNDKKLSFSEDAQNEFSVFSKAVQEIMNTSVKVFTENDGEGAKAVEPLEDLVDKINKEVKKRHVERLRQGRCTIEMGFILSNLSTDLERIADHCSNIAVCIIQLQDNQFDTHEYVESLDKSENTVYRNYYNQYKQIYKLPASK